MEGVKEESCAFQQLVIITGEGNQSIKQRFQQVGIIGQCALLDIDVFDQFAHLGQGRVMQSEISNQNLKGDQLDRKSVV